MVFTFTIHFLMSMQWVFSGFCCTPTQVRIEMQHAVNCPVGEKQRGGGPFYIYSKMSLNLWHSYHILFILKVRYSSCIFFNLFKMSDVCFCLSNTFAYLFTLYILPLLLFGWTWIVRCYILVQHLADGIVVGATAMHYIVTDIYLFFLDISKCF